MSGSSAAVCFSSCALDQTLSWDEKMGFRRQDIVAHICYLPGCAHLLALADAFEREPDDQSCGKPPSEHVHETTIQPPDATNNRKESMFFLFARCVAARLPAE